MLFVQPVAYNLYSFFLNDTATTEIYTLSLPDALPISLDAERERARIVGRQRRGQPGRRSGRDRKRTRLNSSHSSISYAGFCLDNKMVRLRTRCAGLRGSRSARGRVIALS